VLIYTLLTFLNIIPSKWKLQVFSGSILEVFGAITIVFGVIGYAFTKIIENYLKNKTTE
jgi:hypothetical protein